MKNLNLTLLAFGIVCGLACLNDAKAEKTTKTATKTSAKRGPASQDDCLQAGQAVAQALNDANTGNGLGNQKILAAKGSYGDLYKKGRTYAYTFDSNGEAVNNVINVTATSEQASAGVCQILRAAVAHPRPVKAAAGSPASGTTFDCLDASGNNGITILYADASDIEFSGPGALGIGKKSGDVFNLTFENADPSKPAPFSSVKITLSSDQKSVTQVEELNAQNGVVATYAKCALDNGQ